MVGRLRLWRAVKEAMAVLFLLAAALQYNDPDPLRWVASRRSGRAEA
jgi:hypothetical protein